MNVIKLPLLGKSTAVLDIKKVENFYEHASD
jgi:hypothetical protein